MVSDRASRSKSKRSENGDADPGLQADPPPATSTCETRVAEVAADSVPRNARTGLEHPDDHLEAGVPLPGRGVLANRWAARESPPQARAGHWRSVTEQSGPAPRRSAHPQRLCRHESSVQVGWSPRTGRLLPLRWRPEASVRPRAGRPVTATGGRTRVRRRQQRVSTRSAGRTLTQTPRPTIPVHPGGRMVSRHARGWIRRAEPLLARIGGNRPARRGTGVAGFPSGRVLRGRTTRRRGRPLGRSRPPRRARTSAPATESQRRSSRWRHLDC